MAEQQARNNSGALFKNTRKSQPNHPDYTGKGIVSGEEVSISAWLKSTNRKENEHEN